jgi:hypothetical protein
MGFLTLCVGFWGLIILALMIEITTDRGRDLPKIGILAMALLVCYQVGRWVTG